MWAKHLGRSSLLCGALAAGCLAQAAWCAATDEHSAQEVPLSFEASPDVSAVLTRRKLFENGTRWEFKGDTGSIIVAGREILETSDVAAVINATVLRATERSLELGKQ